MYFAKYSIVCSLLVACFAFNLHGQKTIQINIDALLNARPVTTLTKGRLVTWTKGIDGDGLADGYLTQAAAVFNGDTNAHALPDDPLIAATATHPEILLHYNNREASQYQARAIAGEAEFLIEVPHLHYIRIYLGVSSAEGASGLKCTLQYKDGQAVKEYLLPDYYNNVAGNDSAFTYVVTDLAKWGPHNNMTEKNHHNIHLLIIQTDKNRTLTAIRIEKSKPGYLVFWSATGICM